jgi:molybdenum cofactor synthesis domain-containing protein
MRRALIITASNRASAGVYKDLSGAALKEGLKKLGYEVVGHKLVQDDMHQIATTIKSAIEEEIDLIVTTGGTGVSPTDVTPEATKPLIERVIPGFMEALRDYSREKVPTADLTRGLAGVNGNSFIINLPGSPGAVKDGLVIIERLAGHIHDQLAGHDHSQSN